MSLPAETQPWSVQQSGGAAAWPRFSQAQQTDKLPKIGFLGRYGLAFMRCAKA